MYCSVSLDYQLVTLPMHKNCWWFGFRVCAESITYEADTVIQSAQEVCGRIIQSSDKFGAESRDSRFLRVHGEYVCYTCVGQALSVLQIGHTPDVQPRLHSYHDLLGRDTSTFHINALRGDVAENKLIKQTSSD